MGVKLSKVYMQLLCIPQKISYRDKGMDKNFEKLLNYKGNKLDENNLNDFFPINNISFISSHFKSQLINNSMIFRKTTLEVGGEQL